MARVVRLKSMLEWHARGRQPRQYPFPIQALKAASAWTGKTYGRDGYAAAIADLEEWIDARG